MDFEQEFNLVGTEGGVPFDGGKKPIAFIQYLLKIAKGNNKNLVVLDFFAGSGSTGHAFLDGGYTGQVILVQAPEKTYEIKKGKKLAKNNCKGVFNAGFETITQITRKRIENAIGGYVTDKKISKVLFEEELTPTSLKKVPDYLARIDEIKQENEKLYHSFDVHVKDGVLVLQGEISKKKTCPPLGNSLKYYRTSFVGTSTANQATDHDKTILAQKAGCLLALAENTLYEMKKTDSYQIFKDKNHDVWTSIYFKEDYRPIYFNEFVHEVEQLQGVKNVYIFSWGDVGSFDSYFEYLSGVNLKSIPQPILDIYKSLNA